MFLSVLCLRAVYNSAHPSQAAMENSEVLGNLGGEHLKSALQSFHPNLATKTPGSIPRNNLNTEYSNTLAGHKHKEK